MWWRKFLLGQDSQKMNLIWSLQTVWHSITGNFRVMSSPTHTYHLTSPPEVPSFHSKDTISLHPLELGFGRGVSWDVSSSSLHFRDKPIPWTWEFSSLRLSPFSSWSRVSPGTQKLMSSSPGNNLQWAHWVRFLFFQSRKAKSMQ